MLSSPPRPTSPPGNGVSLVSGFGTRGKVRSLGLGTGTALQWGRQHDVQTPAPFAGGGGSSPLPYHGEIVPGEGAEPS